MADAANKGGLTRKLSALALLLGVGAPIAALIAAVGSGAGLWEFGAGFTVLRYALFAAIAGGVLAIIAFVMSRRTGARTGSRNAAALLAAALFAGYLGSQIATARSVPAIHDASTDLRDPPAFTTLTVRADNLDKIPDEDRPDLAALDPLNRWKAIHRRAYPDLAPVRIAGDVAAATRAAETLARARGWTVARADGRAGIVEATATTRFFRFKDDVVVRVRPDPAPNPTNARASIVDMRSINRVGGSDVGVNAARIRDFLRDLKTGAR